MRITQAPEAAIMTGPAGWFTGDVWIETIGDEPEPSRLRASRVTFAPGARTAWHTHPSGQTLHVLDGVARVQARGGPVREVAPGGSVRIEADEWHWHGATPTRPMVHVALQDAAPDGTEARWGDHVSDQDYDPPSGVGGSR